MAGRRDTAGVPRIHASCPLGAAGPPRKITSRVRSRNGPLKRRSCRPVCHRALTAPKVIHRAVPPWRLRPLSDHHRGRADCDRVGGARLDHHVALTGAGKPPIITVTLPTVTTPPTCGFRPSTSGHACVSERARHAGCPTMSTVGQPGPGARGVPWLVMSPRRAAGCPISARRVS